MRPIVELRDDVGELPAGELYHFKDFKDSFFYVRRRELGDFVLLRLGQEKGSISEFILKLEAMPAERDDCHTFKAYL